MKSNRRNFLKYSGLTGIGVAGAAVLKAGAELPVYFPEVNANHFNMSGYAAQK
jgi:hypothetical protein